MLSYRHTYHAGNHADVLKHGVLTLLLRALQRKATPLCYLDTHAGAGLYDLHSAEARKIGEFRAGIARLWARDDIPESLQDYLAIVRECNAQEPTALRFYPGSPSVAHALARPQDRLVLCERHPADHALLAAHFARYPRVHVEPGDGFARLKAFVPPHERRGLVLIDPSYELKADYRAVVTALVEATRRWATGVYALWYPLLTRDTADRLLRRVVATGLRRILRVEFGLRQPDTPGLWGSGMLVVNSPYQVDSELQAALPWLREALQAERGAPCEVSWLVEE